MNENGANDFIISKKVWMTLIGQIGCAVFGSLALNDPNPNHRLIYGAMGTGFGVLAGIYVHTEGKIDAAAVKASTPDTIVNTNVGTENSSDGLQQDGEGSRP